MKNMQKTSLASAFGSVMDFKVILQGILDCLDVVGEDGGLLVHPDGSAHVIDENGDEVLYVCDLVDDIGEARGHIAHWADHYDPEC